MSTSWMAQSASTPALAGREGYGPASPAHPALTWPLQAPPLTLSPLGALCPVQEAPIPPCIAALSDGRVQIAVDIEDKAVKTCLVQVAADHVRVQITGQLHIPGTSNSIVEFLAKILGVRGLRALP